MKKRGVSPVIATVLLIALVTAAAAIVFLVVIPMLHPTPKAIVDIVNVSDNGDGNFTVIVNFSAQGANLAFNGTVKSSPDVDYLEVVTAPGYTVENGKPGQIELIGSFNHPSTAYTLTLYFEFEGSVITAIAEF